MGYYDKIGAKRYDKICDAYVQLEDNEINNNEFVQIVADVTNGEYDKD